MKPDRCFCCFSQVEELQSYLSPAEVQQVEFIKTIETLCSTPATRCSNPMDTSRWRHRPVPLVILNKAQVDVNHVSSCVLSRVLQMTRSDPESRRLLEEIVREPAQSSVGSLLDCARLDWIRCWDADAQSSVLLSRLHDSSQCDFIL